MWSECECVDNIQCPNMNCLENPGDGICVFTCEEMENMARLTVGFRNCLAKVAKNSS